MRPLLLSRRRCLLVALGFLASWLPTRTAAAGASRLLGLLRSPASAARIGHAYLARSPWEADPERLALALRAALGDAASTRQLRQRLGERVRADFAAGETVQVDGWLLSRSEARLCALAALSAP